LFLAGAAAAPWALQAAPRWRYGVMDGVLGLAMDPRSVGVAAKLGFQGLQVTLGSNRKGKPMPMAVGETQQAFVAASRQHGVALVATYLDMLHEHCLKSDTYARERIAEGIEITKNLGAKILMTVFFGKCELKMHGDTENVTKAFNELIPVAEKAGVVLGFENTLPAGQNIRIHDDINSPMFKIYYDVGNAENLIGVNPAAELKLYGKGRLCQVHIKDKGYLGEGRVNCKEVVAALEEIGYAGYAVLETGSPSRDIEADTKRNLEFLKSL
jgi:sugar phosphate isomerase/epimerase